MAAFIVFWLFACATLGAVYGLIAAAAWESFCDAVVRTGNRRHAN